MRLNLRYCVAGQTMPTWLRHRELFKDKKQAKIAVKVVDIVGNEMMMIVDVAVKK